MARFLLCMGCHNYNIEDADQELCVFCIAKRASRKPLSPPKFSKLDDLLKREFPNGLN